MWSQRQQGHVDVKPLDNHRVSVAQGRPDDSEHHRSCQQQQGDFA
jgi:hypothetical protein